MDRQEAAVAVALAERVGMEHWGRRCLAAGGRSEASHERVTPTRVGAKA